MTLTFDEICKYLEDNGFTCIHMSYGNDRLYTNETGYLEINIKEDIPESEMSPEDVRRVEQRLKDLGYL